MIWARRAQRIERLGRGSMFKLFAKLGLSSVMVLGVVTFGLLFANFWTYSRLTDETDIAILAVSRAADRSYIVELETADGRQSQLPVRGDAWQLDARVIKWKGWAQLLGRSPMYRIERLSGRYFDVQSELERPRSVHALSENPGLDLWRLARQHSDWLPGVDAAYGSSTYLPLRDGARYSVSLSGTGLVARPLNDTARRAVAQWN